MYWRKGSSQTFESTSLPYIEAEYTWIGVRFGLQARGLATMKLTAKFIDELLQQIEPLCATKGSSLRAEVNTVVGRVARIAYVIPEAL